MAKTPDCFYLILQYLFPALGLLFACSFCNAQQPFLQKQTNRTTQATVTCYDSSFVKIIENPERADYFNVSIETADGSIVAGGNGRNRVNGPANKFFAAITRFLPNGEVQWARELRASTNYEMPLHQLKELKDGSILATGIIWNNIYPTNAAEKYDVYLAKLSANGDLLWFKTFNSTLASCYQGDPALLIKGIAEAPGGELYIGAEITNCIASSYLSVFALSSSGSLLWSNAFAFPDYSGLCAGIICENNTLTLAGSALNTPAAANKASVCLFSINRFNGSLLQTRVWQDTRPMPENFSYYFQNPLKFTKTKTGNYLLQGASSNPYSSAYTTRFLFAEFDTAFNFKTAWAVIPGNLPYYLFNLQAATNSNGDYLYTFGHRLPSGSFEIYTGLSNSNNLTNERMVYYDAATEALNNQAAAQLKNGAAVLISTLVNNTTGSTRFEFRKIHMYDTPSVCLGTASGLARKESYTLNAIPFSFTSAGSNSIFSTTINSAEVLPVMYTTAEVCKQPFTCNKLQINGPQQLCGNGNLVTYTATKNRDCAKKINWQIDTAAATIVQQPNDTTILVHFRKNWQGYLTATLDGDCSIADSLLLTFTATATAPVTLGPDRELCAQNTLLLKAGSEYASYRWQNGSTDSTLLVTQPGLYAVTVTDACANTYSDTILITPAPPVLLNLGPDRSKCNNDTLQLNAPAGFLNYSWSPAYNLSNAIAQTVTVNPVRDTTYFLKAEKTPGCFGYDTVFVKVNSSPPIQLGADLRFCEGDSALLQAGPGFVDYSWNNGTRSPQLLVKTQGTYSIKATTAEGCSSADTIQVFAPYALPVLQLNKDSLLCNLSSRTLNAGSFSAYSWNTGQTTASITVNTPGLYAVTVTDANGCKASDSARITTLLPLPAGFLGADTSICSYDQLSLQAPAGYNRYLWNNGATTGTIMIQNPGVYSLLVTDKFGCSGIDSINVVPKQCLTGFYIPNAFTPNNDGLNDLFRPFLFGNVLHYSFSIYNRMGEQVFTTTNLQAGWNGTAKAKPQDPGVFVWKCNYQLAGEQPQQRKGTVVLVR